MSTYLHEQLKSIKENKKELEEKYLRIQKKLELELEKNRILEMEGSIDKLKVQVNELSETNGGEIMYNNIRLIHYQLKKDFKKDFDEWHKLQQSGKLDTSELETKRLILRQREIDLPKETNGKDDEKLITLKKFKHNLSKINDETKNYFTSRGKLGKRLVEIKPEIKIYDDILPIFRTMIAIIAKQQDEINNLKQKI